jgi:hypothetical protein
MRGTANSIIVTSAIFSIDPPCGRFDSDRRIQQYIGLTAMTASGRSPARIPGAAVGGGAGGSRIVVDTGSRTSSRHGRAFAVDDPTVAHATSARPPRARPKEEIGLVAVVGATP